VEQQEMSTSQPEQGMPGVEMVKTSTMIHPLTSVGPHLS
jgi:hypothetical protein